MGGIAIGDSIAKVLTYIQMHVQLFGKMEIVASKDDLNQPLFIMLPETGKNISLYLFLGIKFKFDAKH